MKQIAVTCAVCGKELPARKTGRPRLYCSNTCRVAAQRMRQAQQAKQPESIGIDLPVEIRLGDLAGLASSNPDEMVFEAIMRAHQTVAALEVAAQAARPQFAWRCRDLADAIGAAIRRDFEPG